MKMKKLATCKGRGSISLFIPLLQKACNVGQAMGDREKSLAR